MAAPPAAPVLVLGPAARPVAGVLQLPGDRAAGLSALACAALSLGRSRIDGVADTAETRAFLAALRALGVGIDRTSDGALLVQGRGVGGLAEPDRVLDAGDSGAIATLLLGLTATHPLTATIGGCPADDQPSAALIDRLTRIGARLALRSRDRLPGTIVGAAQPLPASHRVDGVWERAALMLAGLNIPGRTTVQSATATPQAIDGLLGHFGAPPGGVADAVEITGYAELSARPVRVPGDGDLASLMLLAALARPDGQVVLPQVATGRIGGALLPVLPVLGADLTVADSQLRDGLPVADLCLRPSRLTGASIDLSTLSVLADDLPFLLAAAGLAAGQTRLTGIASWRRDLDRLVPCFTAAGLSIADDGDGLVITGGRSIGAVTVSAAGNGPLALALAALGCAGQDTLTVTAFPAHRYPVLTDGLSIRGDTLTVTP